MTLATPDLVAELNHLCDEGKYKEALRLVEGFLEDAEFLDSIVFLRSDWEAWLELRHGQILYETGDLEHARKKLMEAFLLGGNAVFSTVDQKYFMAIWDAVRLRQSISKWLVRLFIVSWAIAISSIVMSNVGLIELPDSDTVIVGFMVYNVILFFPLAYFGSYRGDKKSDSSSGGDGDMW